MLLRLRALTLAALAALLPLAAAAPPETLTGARWLRHFQEDLLPFWNLPDAWGNPRGAFPTLRCNDGRLPDPKAPCPELAELPGWLQPMAGRDYTRMQARQTFFYGAAYHLTGDPAMLALARDGVRWLHDHAIDRENGGAWTWTKGGERGPAVLHRTSQDLAYAQLGLAMYYHLTRDPEVLQDLQAVKAHIFGKYWDDRWGMLRWTVAETPEGEHLRQELVAQLDQVNAYLLLVTPLLPEPLATEWKADLARLAEVMRRHYYDPASQLFWGTLHHPNSRKPGARHNDFGHTGKAFWMLERTGALLGDRKLQAFARGGARRLLDRAWLPQNGSWASRLERDGSLSTYKEWWIYAELDQLAGTLALTEPRFRPRLARTGAFWLEAMVDHQGHEVWGGVADRGDIPEGSLKIHAWKSGYHSAEHALVSYLVAQAVSGRPAVLHFALPGDEPVRPYVFSGRVASRSSEPLPGFPCLRKVTVGFTGLR